jgi:hypothetical protein
VVESRVLVPNIVEYFQIELLITCKALDRGRAASNRRPLDTNRFLETPTDRSVPKMLVGSILGEAH